MPTARGLGTGAQPSRSAPRPPQPDRHLLRETDAGRRHEPPREEEDLCPKQGAVQVVRVLERMVEEAAKEAQVPRVGLDEQAAAQGKIGQEEEGIAQGRPCEDGDEGDGRRETRAISG